MYIIKYMLKIGRFPTCGRETKNAANCEKWVHVETQPHPTHDGHHYIRVKGCSRFDSSVPNPWIQTTSSSGTLCPSGARLSRPFGSLWLHWSNHGLIGHPMLGVTKGWNVFVLGSLRRGHLLVLTNLRLGDGWVEEEEKEEEE